MIPAHISVHAETRMRQRGVPDELAAALLDFADKEVDLGHGAIALSFTRKGYQRLCSARGTATAERAKRLLVVLAGDTVVTVMHNTGKDARRYVNSRS